MASKPPQNHTKPTSSNPWDIPPPEAEGSPSADDIYRSVGAALSAWEELEIQLSSLFTILCQTSTTAVVRAYGAAIAHGARNDMLAAAAEIYFYRHEAKKDEKAEFEQVRRGVASLSGRRNDIAHGHCVSLRTSSRKYYYYLQPSSYSSNKINATTFQPKFRYTAEQIFQFKLHFNSYAERVVLLKRALMIPKP